MSDEQGSTENLAAGLYFKHRIQGMEINCYVTVRHKSLFTQSSTDIVNSDVSEMPANLHQDIPMDFNDFA